MYLSGLGGLSRDHAGIGLPFAALGIVPSFLL